MTSEEMSERGTRGGRMSGLARRGVPISTRKRRKQLETAAWWVATHPVTESPPSELHRALQELRFKDGIAFMRNVLLQVLPSPPREPALPPEEKVPHGREIVGDALDVLNKWMEERNKRLAEAASGQSG